MTKWIVPQRELTIDLTGDFVGAQLVCKLDVSIQTFLDLQQLSTNENTLIKSYEMFGDEILLSWNFTKEDGSALPASGKGMLGLPPAVAIGILTSWTKEASGNPIDSSNELQNSSTLAEESIKTESV
jgi:hypothetical protein|tara:strand:- start:167 stop:547 length:381 start_codon:yes stop_codon:yes gene_type:complete